jgi:hypothetical protein
LFFLLSPHRTLFFCFVVVGVGEQNLSKGMKYFLEGAITKDSAIQFCKAFTAKTLKPLIKSAPRPKVTNKLLHFFLFKTLKKFFFSPFFLLSPRTMLTQLIPA